MAHAHTMRPIPADCFGKTLSNGDMIAYAVSKGQAAVLKIARIIKEPARNDSGIWKLTVRPVYDPTAGRQPLQDLDVRKASIEASLRVIRLDKTEEEVRRDAAAADAVYRLGGDLD